MFRLRHRLFPASLTGRRLRFKHRANKCFFCHISNAFCISRIMQNNLIPTNYDTARRLQAPGGTVSLRSGWLTRHCCSCYRRCHTQLAGELRQYRGWQRSSGVSTIGERENYVRHKKSPQSNGTNSYANFAKFADLFAFYPPPKNKVSEMKKV